MAWMGIGRIASICFWSMLGTQAMGALLPLLCLEIAEEKDDGTEIDLPIYIFYLAVCGFLLNSAISLISNEWRELPRPTWKDLLFNLICGVLSAPVPQHMYVLSLAFASTRMTSISAQLIPAVVFLLNGVLSLCRREKFSITTTFVVKVVGSFVLPIASASLQFFINEGPLTGGTATTMHLPSNNKSAGAAVVGFILSIAGSKTTAAWFTNYIQEMNVNREFSYTFRDGALMNFFGALAAMIYAVCRYRDRKHYNLQLNHKLGWLATVGAIVSALTTAGARWCEQRKGTLYVARFSNLSLILDTIFAPILVKLKGEGVNHKLRFYILSGVSVLVDIIGACAFNWAKKKEKAGEDAAPTPQSAGDQPQEQEAAIPATVEDIRNHQGGNSVVQPRPESLHIDEFEGIGIPSSTTADELHQGMEAGTTDPRLGSDIRSGAQNEITEGNNVLENTVSEGTEAHHHHEPDSQMNTNVSSDSSQHEIIRGIEGTPDNYLHQGMEIETDENHGTDQRRHGHHENAMTNVLQKRLSSLIHSFDRLKQGVTHFVLGEQPELLPILNKPQLPPPQECRTLGPHTSQSATEDCIIWVSPMLTAYGLQDDLQLDPERASCPTPVNWWPSAVGKLTFLTFTYRPFSSLLASLAHIATLIPWTRPEADN